MLSRRKFLQVTDGRAAAAIPGTVLDARATGAGRQRPRAHSASIGTGTRGTMVAGFFARHKDCQVVAACDVDKTRLDQFMTKMTTGGGDNRRLRGLPAHPRAQGRRRRARGHAGPLARSDDRRGLRGRQGRLRREAGVERHRAGVEDGRGRPRAQAGRPGGPPAAAGRALQGSREAGAGRPDRQGDARRHAVPGRLHVAARADAGTAGRVSTGTCSRGRRRAGRTSPAASGGGGRTTTTAADWSPTGASTSWTSRTGT